MHIRIILLGLAADTDSQMGHLYPSPLFARRRKGLAGLLLTFLASTILIG